MDPYNYRNQNNINEVSAREYDEAKETMDSITKAISNK